MDARTLRKALRDAVSRVPNAHDSLAARAAARPWRQQVVRRAFESRESLAQRERSLLLNVLPGHALNPAAIAPEIIRCQTEEDFLVFSYFSLWSSFPTIDRPGRRLKFLIRDRGQPSRPLIGLCCLSSPVRQLRVRDEWIGWQGSEHLNVRARNLVYVSDLSTCISLPPYSYLTGGKLLAALMASDEARHLYRSRHKSQLTLKQKIVARELYLLTSSGCYGSNSPQYKGIRLRGLPVYQFLGYSRGYSHFQIDPTLDEDVKKIVLRRRPDVAGQFRTWANSKIRVLRMATRELSIPEEQLVFSGHRRALFAAPLAQNWRELLLGRTERLNRISYPAAEIVDYWKRTWLSQEARELIRN